MAQINHCDRWFISCTETIFSRILNRKDRFDTGLSLHKEFFRGGLTTADLKQAGKIPAESEEFIIVKT